MRLAYLWRPTLPDVDDDMVLEAGFFAPLLLAFDRVPDLFCATAQILFPAGVRREETGKAFWRTRNFNNIRVRMVEYTPGYLADHWCDRGHVLYVVEGELDTELRDGRKFKLLPGMSYQVSDHGDAAHRSSTKVGAKIFIVD